MNRTVLFSRFGGPEVLEVVETPIRQPNAGEVRIKVHALGLNRGEIMYRTGAYTEQPQFPSRLGHEAAGVIEAVGAGVTGYRLGDRVSTIPGMSQNLHGVAGDTAVVPVKHVARLPDSLTFEEGAAVWMQYLTAYGGLVHYGNLHRGHAVVITAASSSVGLAAIQMVKDAGGTSIAVTRKADKKAGLLAAGAKHVVVTDDENLTDRVNALTDGKGANIVFDPIGGATLERLGEVTAEDGLIVVYGVLVPGVPVFPLMQSVVKAFRVQGFHIGFQIVDKPERLTAGVEYVSRRLASGTFKPVLAERRFTLPTIADAYRYMESNEQLGKIVVAV